MACEIVASDMSRPLWPILSGRFAGAARLDISSAFFTDASAVAAIVSKHPRVVRAVVSAHFPTQPEALRNLRDQLDADVRVAQVEDGGSFHEKLYIARTDEGKPLAAYLGSANWTRGGMHRNQEIGVLIEGDKFLTPLGAHFDSTHASARPLSEADLSGLAAEHARQKNATAPGAVDHGKMRWRWKSATG